jgi:hypothetical protein
MKTQLVFALAALAPCLCDSSFSSDPFPKPLVLDFYQRDHEELQFYKEPALTIDDGDSPNKDNPSYLEHMKWASAGDPKRRFTLKSSRVPDVSVCILHYRV